MASGETVYQFIERRERELTNRSLALRGELEAIETELAHIRSAKRQIGNMETDDKARWGLLTTNSNAVADLVNNAWTPPSLGASLAGLSGLVTSDEPTIKQLIVRALGTAFSKKGATSAELRQFILDAYGRDIPPTSMSPQLTRLKAEHLIKQKEGDVWRLTIVGGQRASESSGEEKE